MYQAYLHILDNIGSYTNNNERLFLHLIVHNETKLGFDFVLKKSLIILANA